MQYFTLNTRRQVPAIGFGTWEISPDREARSAVTAALEAGYRVIDTARIYRNERGVGEAVRESGIPRQDILVTTKLWSSDQGYDSTLYACEASLERLGLDYLDIYLIHWPATPRRHDSWRAFEKLYADGIIKAAGVSNYTVEHLEQLLERSELVPAINQVEFHPFIYEQQRPLLEYCQKKGILVEAYSPLRRISDEGQAVIADIAKRYAKSPQQLILRWCVQHGAVPLPRSHNLDHIRANFDIFNFTIDEEDMRRLDLLSDGERVTWDPTGLG